MRLRCSAAASSSAAMLNTTTAVVATAVPSAAVAFSCMPCGRAAAIFAAMNGAGFAVSIASGGSHLHLDLIGSGAFVAAAAATRGHHARTRLSAALVGVWGARLGSFLFYRVVNSSTQHDMRLDNTSMRNFWAASFLWGIICSLPHTIGAGAARPPSIGVLGIGAAGLACAGIVLEAVADWQKLRFKSNPANNGRFCSVGLYSFVQQPNYLGDVMLWTGVLLLNAPSMFVAGAKSKSAAIFGVAALSPVFMLALFYGQMHGFITDSAQLRHAKYGSDPAFADYVQRTPLILPFIPPPQAKSPAGSVH